MGDSASSTIASQPEPEAKDAPERSAQGTPEDAQRPQDEGAGTSSAEDRRSQARPPGRGGDTGLYPPKNPGRSTRMIGEVVVDLGFADGDSLEEAVTA